MKRSVYEDFVFQVSQAICMFVGCVLLTIGLSGSFGVFLQPISEISFLIEPMGFGAHHDQVYWYGLALGGAWLVLFFWVRAAALFAIGLIGFKWAVFQGLITPSFG